MASLQYAKLKKHLNLASDSEASSTRTIDNAKLDLKDIHQRIGPEKQESAPESGSEQPTEGPPSDKATGQAFTGNWSSDLSKKLSSWPAPPGMDDEIASAMKAFGENFARTWKPVRAPPERGTVFFSGLIELVGPNGVAVLDVRAAFHAAEGRWTQIGVGIRRMQSKKQTPKGGR